jgi:hypothetical protein
VTAVTGGEFSGQVKIPVVHVREFLVGFCIIISVIVVTARKWCACVCVMCMYECGERVMLITRFEIAF